MARQNMKASSPTPDNMSGEFISAKGSFLAISISAVIAAAYGAVASFNPFTTFDALLCVIATVFAMACFALPGRSLLARLFVAVPGSAVCLTALWFGWVWAEADFATAFALLSAGPGTAFEAIVQVADGSNYISSKLVNSRGEYNVPPGEIKLVWSLESIAFFLAPFAGAWADLDGVRNMMARETT
ncbi:hypothetical protein [Parasphingorhabdus cellanae]|uniref:Uncharacterized protein n=1 Tax=Parasphingorhabdus cellanae TaxID=2806553 RepID=A0ABX7T2M5_9SPHN|nr:hypothetical protein [Parasphingorhabdus cellanae]QTD55057.1 hypothetical protein J4G78_12575 [Parasphingorhabdus cellanae]